MSALQQARPPWARHSPTTPSMPPAQLIATTGFPSMHPKPCTNTVAVQVEYSDEPGKLYNFKYPLAGETSGGHLPVATTRPETILGDTAVAVHPQDPRYKHLIGRECGVPLCDGR